MHSGERWRGHGLVKHRQSSSSSSSKGLPPLPRTTARRLPASRTSQLACPASTRPSPLRSPCCPAPAAERQWFKSVQGLGDCIQQTGRNESFCAWTLLPENPQVLVSVRDGSWRCTWLALCAPVSALRHPPSTKSSAPVHSTSGSRFSHPALLLLAPAPASSCPRPPHPTRRLWRMPCRTSALLRTLW